MTRGADPLGPADASRVARPSRSADLRPLLATANDSSSLVRARAQRPPGMGCTTGRSPDSIPAVTGLGRAGPGRVHGAPCRTGHTASRRRYLTTTSPDLAALPLSRCR